MIQTIDIASLSALGTTDFEDAEAVAVYVEALRAGVSVPPIAICEWEGRNLIIDGNHRLRAHRLLGTTTIAVQVFAPKEMVFPSAALRLAVGATAEFRRRWALRKSQNRSTMTETVALKTTPAPFFSRASNCFSSNSPQDAPSGRFFKFCRWLIERFRRLIGAETGNTMLPVFSRRTPRRNK